MLHILRDDGRISISELAKKAHISRANAYARMRRLEEQGAIVGFTVVLDPKKVGLGTAALIGLTVEQGDWRAVRDELPKMPEVEYFAVTSGDYDFVVLVRAPNMETIRDVVLDRLHGMAMVRGSKTFFVLDDCTPRPVVLP